MAVEPRMLAALVGENGLKSLVIGPDGLLSMVSVALDEDDADGVVADDEQAATPTPNSDMAQSAAAVLVL
jgi:hypothetical protein